MEDVPTLVTGIRVLDLLCPMPVGGTIAMSGDEGTGVNVLAMETMLRLCRRYSARALVKTPAHGPFNEINVNEWVAKLRVKGSVDDISAGVEAEILIANSARTIARIMPFAVSNEGADAWAVLRRAVLASGRLPAVDLSESSSRLADSDPKSVAAAIKSAVAAGNSALIDYLSQPFFVAEPWTGKPGETTEPDELRAQVAALIAAGRS